MSQFLCSHPAVPTTDSADEIFDVVDQNDHVTGRATRNQVHATGLLHRAVHILVFNPHGDLFIQKRALTKDTFPGRYDSSASGHLNTGEEYNACAVREVGEELGLTIAAASLRKLFKIPACRETGWEFVWVYSAITRQVPRINPDEIQSGAFWTLERVQSEVTAHPELFAPSFMKVFARFMADATTGRGPKPVR